MTIEPTPHRYRVDACEPRSDPRRMATISDVLTENILTVTTEDEARHLIAQLTAWLDAPRLAARKPISSCAVIDVDYSTGVALIKSKAGEWGVIDSDGLSHAPGWLDAPGMLHDWYATEAEGRAAYRGETGKVSCESCAKFIDHDAATVDDEGIYTCADVSTCGAGIITEATP